MKNYTITLSNDAFLDTIVVKACSEKEVISILKSYGFKDSDFTEDYNYSRYADCYMPPKEEEDNIIEQLSADFEVVYVYEKHRKYEVICGFEIDKAYDYKNINLNNVESIKNILKLNLPKEFIKLIYDKLNESLIKLEKNNSWEQILLNLPTMDKDDISNYLSRNRVRKYDIEHLRQLLKEEADYYILEIQKDINELKEKLECFYNSEIGDD